MEKKDKEYMWLIAWTAFSCYEINEYMPQNGLAFTCLMYFVTYLIYVYHDSVYFAEKK
jgi:hypothetical protein